MRNYENIDKYLNELLSDVYPQPPDPDPSSGHTAWFHEVVTEWVTLLQGVKNVLDVGAGQGQFQQAFEDLGLVYCGVSLGQDVLRARENQKNVYNSDFSFLPYSDNSFDLVFSRHSLEHSPMPVLTLMEWNRVSKQFLCVILPNPKHFTYRGKNHYSVMDTEQFRWLAGIAGWKIIWDKETEFELRFMCQKSIPVRE